MTAAGFYLPAVLTLSRPCICRYLQRVNGQASVSKIDTRKSRKVARCHYARIISPVNPDKKGIVTKDCCSLFYYLSAIAEKLALLFFFGSSWALPKPTKDDDRLWNPPFYLMLQPPVKGG